MNMPALEWEQYINAEISADLVDQCRCTCTAAFSVLRETLRELYLAFQPQRIGCLGAGCLNDIPIEEFVHGGSEVYLIDWIPRISEEGFRSDLIKRDGDTYACFVCEVQGCPERFCAAFRRTAPGMSRVCDNFCLVEGSCLRCARYRPGVEPHFVTADVTCGRATRFARRAGRLVASSKTPQQCFRKALAECQHCVALQEEVPIPSGSLDLVTSSMVVSQFDHEPYTFFSKLLALHFGSRLLAEEQQLLPLMEKLRAELFRVQIAGHVRELHRLVNKERGKVYFSVELFRSLPASGTFFLVHEIPQAMAVLGQYFVFDFTAIPPERALRSIQTAAGTSIIQSYVLLPLR